MRNLDARTGLFWAGALVLLGVRLALLSDLSVQILYSPHDDSLYVDRAYRLLQGEGFGPYDSVVLVKYPGMSLWLAAMREIGVPFLLSVNLVYIGAGFYLATALLRAGGRRSVVLAALALYLLNPITLGLEWTRVIREPLGTGLLVLMLGAMAHVLVGIEKGSRPWAHALVLAPVFAFALFLREDDRLLWGLLALFTLGVAWQMFRMQRARTLVGFLAVASLVPAGLALTYEYALRAFVDRHYGLPLLHEFGEGEYPRLLAAIRSIHSAKDNRLVMVTQEALGKLRSQVPAFRPVIDRLPPPGPGTFSCRLQGVCSEWSNGWMPFWIRDEAYRAGLTPTLAKAQHFYRAIADEIRTACAQGRLSCTPKGEGLIPPMELRWTRAYVAEAWRLAGMALAPSPKISIVAATSYAVSPELAQRFHAVTMTTAYAADAPARDANRASDGWQEFIATSYRVIAAAVLLVALGFFALRLWRWTDGRPPGALALIAIVFGLYSLVRLAALSYVAVFMGPFDPRMVFSTYAAGVILALPFIADSIKAAARRRGDL